MQFFQKTWMKTNSVWQYDYAEHDSENTGHQLAPFFFEWIKHLMLTSPTNDLKLGGDLKDVVKSLLGEDFHPF